MQRHSLIENQKRALTTGPAHILSATFTLEYTFSPGASNTVVAAFEYRYDRSTVPEGGFFKGDANTLVPDQHQFVFPLIAHFHLINMQGGRKDSASVVYGRLALKRLEMTSRNV